MDDHRAADRGAGSTPGGYRGGPLGAGTARGDDLWGLERTEIDGERFVALPAGALMNPPWTAGGLP